MYFATKLIRRGGPLPLPYNHGLGASRLTLAGSALLISSLLGHACSPAASTPPDSTSTSDAGTTQGSTTTTGSDPTTADDDSSGDASLPCNGATELCSRTYDTVVFPGTHNAFAATAAGFSPFAANQTLPMAEQLEDGIRVMLLDVLPDGDGLALCHSDCAFGSIPHLQALAGIEAFLAAHPREVLTIIYQDDADQADVVADLEASGLVDRAYVHEGGAWPTLGEMIDAGTTLVITAENGGAPPPWYHHVWDEAWDTGYTWMSIDAFDCEPNRGAPDHALFLLNHWVSNATGLPDAGAASEANALSTLLARVQACPRLPTFLAVDYYDQGDLFAAVASLNGLD